MTNIMRSLPREYQELVKRAGVKSLTEREIERRMCRRIHARGGLTFKFTSPNAPGVPDRIVITPAGIVWFVELKTVAGRLTKLQQWQINRLRKLDANVRILRGWDDVIDFVDWEVMPSGV